MIRSRNALATASIAALTALASGPACAHVKWFADYDIMKAPMPIGDVLSGTFISFLLVSAALVYLFFLVDRYLYRRAFLAGVERRLRMFDGLSARIMRISASVFFLSLWVCYLRGAPGFYLAPELKTPMNAVPWLHLVLGLCALLPFTTTVTGVGILVLYGLAAGAYGWYHLIDYLIFVGIGYFFVVASIEHGQWRKSGFVVLFASTGLTLMWAAIEKFGYPQWSYPLLEKNPGMLMGMSASAYMVLAGFVEFSMAFILLGAASVAGRLAALGLQAVLMLVVLRFGLIDAAGHLMIVATLFVLVLLGPNTLQEKFVLRGKSVWIEACFMTGLYFLAFVTVFILYYSLHRVAYGA
jgi:uncharacterized membrane protein